MLLFIKMPGQNQLSHIITLHFQFSTKYSALHQTLLHYNTYKAHNQAGPHIAGDGKQTSIWRVAISWMYLMQFLSPMTLFHFNGHIPGGPGLADSPKCWVPSSTCSRAKPFEILGTNKTTFLSSNWLHALSSSTLQDEERCYCRGTTRCTMLVNSCCFTRYGSIRNVSNSKSDLQGHSRALAMVPFDRQHTISYQCSIATMSLYSTVNKIFSPVSQNLRSRDTSHTTLQEVCHH